METKYKAKFYADIRPIVSKDKDKYLALASLEKLKPFLPNIDVDKNYDLLPIVANAFTPNRVNANGHVIDTKTTLDIYKSFIYKGIDLEHSRNDFCGVLLTAGFSEFGTDKPLTEEEVSKMTGPYNCVLGGVLWRLANDELVGLVEDSNDPDSENYRKFSYSWEIGYNEYSLIVLPAGVKNIEGAKEITDPEEIKKLENNLKAFGGNGKISDNEYIYMKAIGGVIPLAIGIVENPAADVKGILTANNTQIPNKTAEIESKLKELNTIFKISNEELKKFQDSLFEIANNTSQSFDLTYKAALEFSKKGLSIDETLKRTKDALALSRLCELNVEESVKSITIALESFSNKDDNIEKDIKTKNNISHSSLPVVNQSRNMKIKDIKDITNDSLKEMQASDIETFINEKLQEAANKIQQEKKDKENAEAKVKELEANSQTLTKNVEELNKKVLVFEADKVAAEKKEKFNQRMAYFDDTYELDSDYSKLIATDLNDISDEAFDSYKKKMELLLRDKNKETISEAAKKSGKVFDKKTGKWVNKEDLKPEDKETKASLDEKEIEAELAKAKEEKSKLPNSATSTPQTLKEKAQAAFLGKDSYKVTLR